MVLLCSRLSFNEVLNFQVFVVRSYGENTTLELHKTQLNFNQFAMSFSGVLRAFQVTDGWTDGPDSSHELRCLLREATRNKI